MIKPQQEVAPTLLLEWQQGPEDRIPPTKQILVSFFSFFFDDSASFLALSTLTKLRDSALELVTPNLLSSKQSQPKYYNTTGKPVCGTGSFGEVVRVPDINDPTRTVAVKTIKSQIARQQPHYCLYLYRELYMLRNLSHPNVISLLDVKAPKFDPNNVEQVEAGGLDGSLDTLQLVFECADYDL
jgi:hypothetical protein